MVEKINQAIEFKTNDILDRLIIMWISLILTPRLTEGVIKSYKHLKIREKLFTILLSQKIFLDFTLMIMFFNKRKALAEKNG